MNISAEKGKKIKSQREKELEELRSKGVAKTRREKLKNCKLTKFKYRNDIVSSMHFLNKPVIL
jgi:hypothetical protein